MLIRPEHLIEPLLRKSKVSEDYELWTMQTDGMIVYDQDTDEIGRMLFTDPAYAGYKSLPALGRKIAANREGKGNYVYLAPGSDKKVIKEVLWETIALYGCEWRIVLGFRPFEEKKL